MGKISDKINATITLEDILSDYSQVEEITASLAKSCKAWYKIELENKRREYRKELIRNYKKL